MSEKSQEKFDPVDLHVLARKWFEIFNRHDVDSLVDLHTEDAVHHSPKLKIQKPETGGVIKGREQLIAWWREAFERIPSLSYVLNRITAQENRVVVEYTRYADEAEPLEVAEMYEVTKIRDALRIRVSRVYHG